MPSTLIPQLVNKLIQLLDEGSELPSITRLAQMWGVSYLTMSKAVRVLAAQGRIECVTGRGIRAIPRANAPSVEPASPGVRDLHGRMQGRILDGSLRTGDALPKLEYYAASEHVSKHTVLHVLRRLDKEGLIHKQGRQWVVGPARQAAPAHRRVGEQPAILLVVPYLGNLRGLFDYEFNSRFMVPFSEEISRAGIRQHVVQMYTVDADARVRERAIGDAEALIRELGSRYLGAFMHRGPYRFDEHHESMDAWINTLGGRNRPLVYFDSHGTSACFSRRRYPLQRGYFRLFFDEAAAVRCALDALVSAGHSRIGFPVPSEEVSEWIVLRAKMAESLAAQCQPAPRIVTVAQKEGIWHAPARDLSDTMYERIATSRLGKRLPTSAYRSPRRALLASTPSFKTLFEQQVTAIIAPNDIFAMAYHTWLDEAGIRIPRDLSVVSFDNSPQAAPLPISTVDFGLSRLGYLGAHILIGDLPVRTDADGNLTGACTLVDRGSVGAPRKSRLEL